MSTPRLDLLADGFDRIAEGVPAVIDGLGVDDLVWRPDPAANPIGWLVWHLARQQDAQIAALARLLLDDAGPATTGGTGGTGFAEAWPGDWYARFALPYPVEAHGYGMSAQDVGRFTVSDPGLLSGYYADVHARSVAILDRFSDDDLAHVVDRNWEPPVTTAVRLVSVLDDAAKHLGQAEYVRGLLERR